MQGQRNTMHPIAESFDLGNISDQNNMNIDSHTYQGEQITLMAAPNLPDYQVSGNSTNCNFHNIGSHASSSSSFVDGWGSGSANNAENAAGQGCTAEDKMSIGWNSISNMQSTSRIDDRQVLDTDVLPSESGTLNILNNPVTDDRLHLCSYGTTSDSNSYNFSANQTPVGNEGRSYMDPSCFSHPSVLLGTEAEHLTFASSIGVGCLPENSNGRANHPMDGRRVPCKRKNTEGISGSSSLDASQSSSHPSQWDEENFRFTVPGRLNIGNSLSISVPSATLPGESAGATLPSERTLEIPVIPRPGAVVSDVSPDYRCGLPMVGQSEGSQRSIRVRLNSAHQRDPYYPQILPSGNAGRTVSDLQSHSSHSRRLFSGNLSVDTGPQGASSSAPLRQPNMFHASSGIQRSLHSLGWDNSSMPRAGNPSSSTAVGRERTSMQEETSSRNIMTGIANNAWVVAGTESRPPNHDSGNWVPVNRNTNESRSTASMLHPPPVMPWGPHYVPLAQATRRSGGSVQGSGLSSSINRASQSGHIFPSRTIHSSSSSDNLQPPGTGFQGPQYLRSALLMERQGDGILGVPFGSLQALAEGEGRNRLMTEIRNVLELMRRGENLRFEDILILDQSAFYSAADIHDQHRDMRLDVDNMSYEELLALEERIGNVSTGLTEETVCKRLRKSIYLSCNEPIADESSKKQPEDELCSICREEYEDNDELGILDCGHIHHSHCIKKWLLLKNLCPICKKTALNT